MTSGDPVVGQHFPWDGDSPAVEDIRGILAVLAPEGCLRLVLQRLALHEHGRPVGEHEVIDAVADVDGNLVSVPLTVRVRVDPPVARAVDEAVARLRRDVLRSGVDGIDSISLILDADGRREVQIAFGLDVTPAEAQDRPAHPAIHDGAHHITHHAPALDDLRDRLAQPALSPWRRVWGLLRGLLTGRSLRGG